MSSIGLDEVELQNTLGGKWEKFQVLVPPPSSSNTGRVMDGTSEAWTYIKKFLRSEAASMAMTQKAQEAGCAVLARPKVPPDVMFPTPYMRAVQAAREEAKEEQRRWAAQRMEMSRAASTARSSTAPATFNPRTGPPKPEDAFQEGGEAGEEGGNTSSVLSSAPKPKVQSWLQPMEDKSMWSSVDEWRAGERGAETGYKVESFRELRTRRKVFVGIDALLAAENSQKSKGTFTWGGRIKATKAPFNPERNRLIHRGFYVT